MGSLILFFLGIASIITGIALAGMPADNGLPFLLFAVIDCFIDWVTLENAQRCGG